MTTSSNKSPVFFAAIKERYSLNKPGSKKSTYHIELDLKGSGIQYQVGDSLAIHPHHDPEIIKNTLEVLNATGDEIVQFRSHTLSLKEIITSKASITQTTKKFLGFVVDKLPQSEKRSLIEDLLQDHRKDDLKEFLNKCEPWQLLTDLPAPIITPQEFCDHLSPLLPRFYSIASAPNVVGEEVHLTVALVRYEHDQRIRHGVCSHYLCNIAELNSPTIPVYVQSNHGFTLPEDPTTPIIMIGPGTGVAPFRAFMQARMEHPIVNNNWLFFGDWTRSYDFLYEDFWMKLQQQGKLQISAAFSRDNLHKVYVQDLMHENSEQFFKWLEAGAFLYVCGDANRMAKDVDLALQQIVAKEGNLDEAGAKAYVKQLRSQKRYLRDVY